MEKAEMEKYESQIQCSRDCDVDCKAHERGVYEAHDDDEKLYVVAGHDLSGVQDPETGRMSYGAWWQVFEGPMPE